MRVTSYLLQIRIYLVKKVVFNTNSHLKNITNVKGSLIIILKFVNVMDNRLFKTTFL